MIYYIRLCLQIYFLSVTIDISPDSCDYHRRQKTGSNYCGLYWNDLYLSKLIHYICNKMIRYSIWLSSRFCFLNNCLHAECWTFSFLWSSWVIQQPMFNQASITWNYFSVTNENCIDFVLMPNYKQHSYSGYIYRPNKSANLWSTVGVSDFNNNLKRSMIN